MYDLDMTKRRVTWTIDADLLEALEHQGASSVSAAANSAIRRGIEDELHRQAALAWLDELDAIHGAPTPAEQQEASNYLDSIGFGESETARAA